MGQRTRLSWIVVLLVMAQVATAQEPTVPEDTARAEVEKALVVGIDAAENLPGGAGSFAAAVRPYGPLDLVVTKSPDGRYSAQLRSFFYGAVAAAAGVSQETAIGLPNEFHCGPPCAETRSRDLAANLESIRRMVAQFEALDGIDVLAAWPGADFRVGELIYTRGAYVRTKHSPVLGLWPWETQRIEDQAAVLADIQADHAGLTGLVQQMRDAHIAAMVGSRDAGVRVVMDASIGPNEAGLLFLENESRLPKIDVHQLDGRVVVAIRRLAKGVYFYTST